jgi:hypothetical protein
LVIEGVSGLELKGTFLVGTLRLSGRGKTHIHVEIQRELGITPPTLVPYLLMKGMLIVMDPQIRIPEAKTKLKEAFEYLDYLRALARSNIFYETYGN